MEEARKSGAGDPPIARSDAADPAALDPETSAELALAGFFAELLLFELDEPRRAALLEPEIAAALLDLEVDAAPLASVPLDELAAAYLQAFVQPERGGPPVQSLWTEGSFEGDAAVALRQLAEASGADFDRDAARGAPVDHLGCILSLWVELVPVWPEAARRIEEQHLAWALRPLGAVAAGSPDTRAASGGSEAESAQASSAAGVQDDPFTIARRFYGQVARALGRFLQGFVARTAALHEDEARSSEACGLGSERVGLSAERW